VEDLEGVPREVGEEDVVMAVAVEEVDFPVAEDEEGLLAVVVAGTYHTVDRWPVHISFASFVCLFDIRVVVVVRMVQV
jgi:hypothetical protein